MDDDFIHWLSQKLDMCQYRLKSYIESWVTITSEPLETRGRKGLSEELQQQIVNAWLSESMITVDRRSGRDKVVMKKEIFKRKFGHLEFPDDIVIEEFTSYEKLLLSPLDLFNSKKVCQV